MEDLECVAKDVVIDKGNVCAHIIALGIAIDKLGCRRKEIYIPVPDWMYPLALELYRSNEALTRFKKNSSYWM
jgi:hypothetical protein